jgi:hypothetical protein
MLGRASRQVNASQDRGQQACLEVHRVLSYWQGWEPTCHGHFADFFPNINNPAAALEQAVRYIGMSLVGTRVSAARPSAKLLRL